MMFKSGQKLTNTRDFSDETTYTVITDNGCSLIKVKTESGKIITAHRDYFITNKSKELRTFEGRVTCWR